MYQPILRALLSVFCCLPTLTFSRADETKSELIEIDSTKIETVDDDLRRKIQDWIIDLESVPLLADQLAVVVTGSYFSGGRVAGGDTVNGRQFTIGWATQKGTRNQRIILQDEGLLDPIFNDGKDERFMRANASGMDQLKMGDRYFEALGLQVRPESKKSKLESQFKQSGLFYPTTATTATATEWYRGTASEPISARVEIERLTGAYEQDGSTIVEFLYQSSDRAILYRYVVFRDGVPIQVEDQMAISDSGRFRRISLLNPQKEDEEQLKDTRSKAVTVARTQSKWVTVKGDFKLPVEMKSVTTKGPHAIEVTAKCMWLLKEQVKPEIFASRTVGAMTPTQWLHKQETIPRTK
ncbi:MAG: hypothetical protein AAGG48_08615 [Planctomycetota bacterium]